MPRGSTTWLIPFSAGHFVQPVRNMTAAIATSDPSVVILILSGPPNSAASVPATGVASRQEETPQSREDVKFRAAAGQPQFEIRWF
jgi:hypothetical protein